jgi:hypothetical protein
LIYTSLILQIDLELVGKFKILKELPRIYDLQSFGIVTEAPKMFDYRRMLRGPLDRTLLPSFPYRSHDERRSNFFESKEVGIGAAKEEDEQNERDRLKKLQVRMLLPGSTCCILTFKDDYFLLLLYQWAKLVGERKAKFLADRQKQIDEEQAKLMEASIVDNREVIMFALVSICWLVEFVVHVRISARTNWKLTKSHVLQ